MDSNIASPRSPKWQFRFDFFSAHGAPSSPGFKAAYKALPFGQKIKVNFNFFALFFGCIYLFILGMWRKALTIVGLTVVLAVVLAFVPDVDRPRPGVRLVAADRADHQLQLLPGTGKGVTPAGIPSRASAGNRQRLRGGVLACPLFAARPLECRPGTPPDPEPA
jgi:hypothetical protein